MKNKKNVVFIFAGLTALFILTHSVECPAEDSMPKTRSSFNIIAGRGDAWKNIIGALQTSVPQKGVVIRFLYPAEGMALLDQHYEGNFYDKWFLGGKDYTEFWRNFHEQNPQGPSGFATDEEEWFLDEASYVGEIPRNFIDDKNYYKVNVLKGTIINDTRGRNLVDGFCSIPFIDRLCNAKLMVLKKNKIIGLWEETPNSLNTAYQFRLHNAPFSYNSAKSPDIADLSKRYQMNLSLLSGNKNGLDKQVVAGLKNIKQDEELPVADIGDNKTLIALNEVLKLLEKAGIKEVHSLTVFPENPNREYLCIPVKVNAILTYDQLKRLSDAVSSAPTLSIIDFLAATNCELKMTEVRPLLEKGLPFSQARCMIIIEFITGFPDKQ